MPSREDRIRPRKQTNFQDFMQFIPHGERSISHGMHILSLLLMGNENPHRAFLCLPCLRTGTGRPKGEEMALSGERKRPSRRTLLQSFLNLNSQGIKRVDWPQKAHIIVTPHGKRRNGPLGGIGNIHAHPAHPCEFDSTLSASIQ